MHPLWIPATGLVCAAVGLALGLRWTRRRGPDPRIQERLEALERARDTAELANLELQEALNELEQAAGTDRLTGAWNRRRFEEAAQGEMALARRRRDPVSLIVLDLDHFKRVNDTHGHAAGDTVLQGAVEALRGVLRASDRVARWGGEGFLVLAPATPLAGALALAEKARAALAEREHPGVGSVTGSLGVAEHRPGEMLEAWVARADAAVYRAKEGGRNRVEADGESGPALETGRPLLEILWEEAYASGHATIDTQHQKLFQLANALLAVAGPEDSHQELSLRLRTLLAHTAQHFHDEEALLTQARYPDLPEHAAEHQRLLRAARGFLADVEAGRLDLAALVAYLAFDLVRGHLLTEDRNYFQHLVK